MTEKPLPPLIVVACPADWSLQHVKDAHAFVDKIAKGRVDVLFLPGEPLIVDRRVHYTTAAELAEIIQPFGLVQ